MIDLPVIERMPTTGSDRIEPVEALVVVDVQAAWVTGDNAVPEAGGLVAAVDELLSAARAAQALVVHLHNDGPAGAADEPDTPGWNLHRTPQAGELVLAKHGDDGFTATPLAVHLAHHRVTRLAICGVLSEMCVAATARAALARGFGVVLPHTAHATYDVPAGPGGSSGVTAPMAARAAEWSLGDQVEIVADPSLIRFATPQLPPPSLKDGEETDGALANTFAVVITGPPGAGKSTVAATTIHDYLGEDSIPNALVEVDELDRCYPPLPMTG
jgi:nicotinamidase-related amidase